jgi:hypothetical protein
MPVQVYSEPSLLSDVLRKCTDCSDERRKHVLTVVINAMARSIGRNRLVVSFPLLATIDLKLIVEVRVVWCL